MYNYQHSVAFPVEEYSGAIVNEMREGVGSAKWHDGSKYEGDWKANLRHGNGKYEHEGEVYVG